MTCDSVENLIIWYREDFMDRARVTVCKRHSVAYSSHVCDKLSTVLLGPDQTSASSGCVMNVTVPEIMTGVKLGGSHWISDPAPLVWDPLPLITDPAPHNWDPAPFCWDPPFCTVYIWVFFSMHDVLLKRSPLRSFCHLHLSVLGADCE